MGDDADAQDALQNALVAIARGIRRFDGRSSFGTWSYRVATNACLDELRRRRRRPVPSALGTGGDDGDGGGGGPGGGGTGVARPDPLDRVGAPGGPAPIGGRAGTAADDGGIGAVSDRLDADAALAQVPEPFRAAVVLRDLCDLDYAEIARVLDVPVGTVRSRIARGRRVLSDLLGNPVAPSDRPTTSP